MVKELKKETIREVCVRCGAACCKLGGTDFTRAEMKRVLKRGYEDHFVKIGRNHFELRCKKAICPYLQKDRTCAIHEVRPLACRSWPVYPEGDPKGRAAYLLLRCPLSSRLKESDIRALRKQASRARGIIMTSFSLSRIPERDRLLAKKRFSKFPGRRLS